MPNSSIWQKSSFSGGEDGDNCVELGSREPGRIALRESDVPVATLAAGPAAVVGLIRHLKAVG